jgi:phage protein D
MTITRQDGDRHRFAVADREAYTAVRATYFDVKQSKRGEVIVNGNTAAALRDRVQAAEQAANAKINNANPADNKHQIQHIYASKAKAIKGAKDQFKKGSYTAVQASYWDEKAKQKGDIEVTAKGTKLLSKQRATGPRVQDTKAKHTSTVDAVLAATPGSTDPSFSDGGNIKTLRHTYATKETAFRGAMSAWQRLQRGLANFSITLAEGRAELMPELPASVSGFKPQIDAIDWTITRVVHHITESGYTTALELEARLTEIPD